MSLSPKDDPRTWPIPGPREVPKPRLQARLLYYDLTKSQRALLRAMVEHAPEGALFEASLETYAETSGLSVRHIWNLIHGWKRNGHRTPGLLELKILECKREARRGPVRNRRRGGSFYTSRPAAYVFNEWALQLRPELIKRLEAGVQQPLSTDENERGDSQVNQVGRMFRQPLPKLDGNRCRNDQGISETVSENYGGISETVSDDSKATASKATARDSTPGGFSQSAPGVSNPQRSRRVTISELDGDREIKDLAKKCCERMAVCPATRKNVELILEVLQLIQRKHGFKTSAQCCEYLEACVRGASIPGHGSLTLQTKPTFFFEDGEYEQFNPKVIALLERDREKRRAARAKGAAEWAATSPDRIVGQCRNCGRPKLEGSTWSDERYCTDCMNSLRGITA
jgi:hypothetical protein